MRWHRPFLGLGEWIDGNTVNVADDDFLTESSI